MQSVPICTAEENWVYLHTLVSFFVTSLSVLQYVLFVDYTDDIVFQV